MIPRRSKSRCRFIRAINDWMRHSYVIGQPCSPTREDVVGFIQAYTASDDPTPEAFRDYLAGRL